MRALLDTHTFLWWISDSGRLSKRAYEFIEKPSNTIYFSSVSCWEISIKSTLGSIQFPKKMESFIAEQISINSFEPLSLNISHAVNIRVLPQHHKDPFDRMLISQSQIEDMPLITGDKLISKYKIELIW